MLKPGMKRTGIDQVCQAKLLDVPQSLKPWMRNDIEDQFTLNMYEPIDRVIDNFLFVQFEFAVLGGL
jgi:hypothetical protein